MFKSYLTISIRNLTKRKGYALLNIFGLAIGIICCLLIFQYVSYQRSYDKFGQEADNVVRLRLDAYNQGKLAWRSATSYPAIGPTLKKEFPEVADFCRIYNLDQLLSNEEKNVKFHERKGYYADPSAINMLGVQIQSGNKKDPLSSPDKMIVSQSFAKKFFGDADPVGKTLTSRDASTRESYMITGVFKDYPKNSHLVMDYLISYSTFGKINRLQGDTSNSTETNWGWYDFYTYVKLKPGTDRAKTEAKLYAFCDRHINNDERRKANNIKSELHIIPLTGIHLYSNANQEAEVNGDGQTVSFLLLIGVLIIVIAWVNYINLATARSVERAREVGVRKVLGANRASLIRQFLVESFLLNVISLLIAFFAAYLLTPAFNRFTGRDLSAGFHLPGEYLTGFFLIFFLGSFLAGIYPAFVLSAFQPVKVLKGMFKNSGGGIRLRKALITAQFIASVILVAGTIIVYQQISFMRSQKLGTNINQTLVLEGAASLPDSIYEKAYAPFKQELLGTKNIKSITASTEVMGHEIYWTQGVKRLAPNSTFFTLYHLGIDNDFIPAYGISLKAGRNFSKNFTTDKKAVMLNEAAVKLLGFKDAASAINEKVIQRDTLTIVGVTANFHQEGLKRGVQPMIFIPNTNYRQYYSVKLGQADVRETVTSVQMLWKKYFPADPFNYNFLDESFNKQYQSDELFGSIFSLFAGLAILIACFGLAGLSAYNILQRRKEIGIRKVMGASIQQLLSLLVNDFLRLVLISFFVSIPLTWFVMNKWLQGFAYRIDISWFVFALAGLVIMLIVIATISFQAIKAATANPVKSLRTE